MAAFLQRYTDDAEYRSASADLLQNLERSLRDRFLTVLLPLLTKLDFDTLLIPILNDVVGPIPLLTASGKIEYANLKEAHQRSVLEIKEEVVGVQLFVAIKHGLEMLYGTGVPVPQDDVAIITGIRIPCAADVPSYFMGISPADLEASRLIHCSQIGSYSLAIVDRRHERGVKVEISTGVLPWDKELLQLRKTVIMEKRSASRRDHGRFFERLTELIVRYVRVDKDNFRVIGPMPFPLEGVFDKVCVYPGKMAFIPGFSDPFPSQRAFGPGAGRNGNSERQARRRSDADFAR
jgi:hypothetical protein